MNPRLAPLPILVATALSALSVPFTRLASADAPPAPPPGWEAPPPLPAPPAPPAKGAKPSKPAKKAAACCGYDETCCSRQTEIDGARPSRVARAVLVRAAELPELVVKEAPKDHPGIEGTPPLRVIDGSGRPFPWPDGPHLEVRVMPPGRFGDIKLGDYAEPFYADPGRQSMGYGVARMVEDKARDKGASLMTASLSYTALSQGEAGKIVVDRVKGVLEGTPDLRATEWSHVEAPPVADGFLHAYRVRRPDGELIVFVLPDVVLGFESKDTTHEGGFEPRFRGSRSWPYTMYTMPLGPGRSCLATFDITEGDLETRWFSRPPPSAKLPRAGRVVLAASQTSTEAEPSVRILFSE